MKSLVSFSNKRKFTNLNHFDKENVRQKKKRKNIDDHYNFNKFKQTLIISFTGIPEIIFSSQLWFPGKHPLFCMRFVSFRLQIDPLHEFYDLQGK